MGYNKRRVLKLNMNQNEKKELIDDWFWNIWLVIVNFITDLKNKEKRFVKRKKKWLKQEIKYEWFLYLIDCFDDFWFHFTRIKKKTEKKKKQKKKKRNKKEF